MNQMICCIVVEKTKKRKFVELKVFVDWLFENRVLT